MAQMKEAHKKDLATLQAKLAQVSVAAGGQLSV